MPTGSSLPRACRPGASLGLDLVLAGAFFLFDPFISVFDLLPDFVGYLLITVGLYRLGDLDDRMADAARLSRRMVLLGVLRLSAVALIFGVISPSEQPTFVLLVLFSLGVLDVIVLVPLWKSLGAGLLYLGTRHDATALLDRARPLRRRPSKKNHRAEHTYNATERYVAQTTVFLILREILVILPETTVLTHERGGAEVGEGTIFYDFVGLFRLFGIAVSLGLGIAWLIITIRFLRRVMADRPFVERLRTLYISDILPRHDLFARRAVKAALIALTAAFACGANFYIDGINIFPDLPVAILFGLSLFLIRRYAGRERWAAVTVGAYGVATLATFLAQFFCLRMEQIADVKDDPALAPRYTTMLVLVSVTAFLFCLASVLVLRAVYRLTLRHTGVAALREGSSYAEDRNRAIHRHLRGKLIAVGIVAAVCAVSSVVQWGVIPHMPDLAAFGGTDGAGETMFIFFYDLIRQGYGVIDFALRALLVGLSVHACSEIFEQMEYSHLMRD